MLNQRARGFTLLEVLITIVILAFGLLGLVNLQSKLHMTEMEAYQRAQAVVLLQDMINRLQANGANAASYLTPTPLGTGNTTENCSNPTTTVARDRCAWHAALQGAAETVGGSNVGGMIGARGCVQQITAPNPAAGICTPGVYRISVVWQGLFQTAAPAAALTCGQNQYGDESYRRVVSADITVGLPKCS
ncbi:MAG TPA: type IV pilus modification protein PilV [Nevskiales bacterium]|nr:type IV pilus modification protein PilV [Nevskiales bacterium]